MSGTTLNRAYQRGEKVHLNSAQGPITRIVWRDYGTAIAVCREDTFRQAALCGREPTTIGFKKLDIIGQPV